MKSVLQVAELVASDEHSHLRNDRFFIVETSFTIDGPRTRICEGRWGSLEAADAHRKQLETERS